ncbi:MAG: hisS [Parcubacteria group bacterium]|nr:hisS [Parcubacteria group bacterium]
MSKEQQLSTEPYKGVRDFYPKDWAKLQYVFDTTRTLLRRNGFEEYNASPLERSELYESKTSEEIVNEQTYTFTDRGERRVTLRPEMTPSLARMVAGKRRELVFPLRWFSIGNRFRYERPQKGRLREFYQVDIDIVGLPGAKAEGEAIVIAHKVLSTFGATNDDFVIRINSRTLLNAACGALKLSSEQTNEYLGLLDRKNKMSSETFETERAVFRRNGTDPLELIEAGTNESVTSEQEKLNGLIEAFSERGMTNVVFEPTVVRGFLYYTGIVFEVFDTNPENPRALMGGGRYDGLVSLFGGDTLPAMGFAFGDVTFIDFLTTHNLLPKNLTGAPDVFVGTPVESDIPKAHDFADSLRAQGLNVLVNVTEKALGDQVKEAVRRTIPYFIAFGETEASSGKVMVKTLAESSQEEMSANEVSAFIKKSTT